jgi:hypothetical protein
LRAELAAAQEATEKVHYPYVLRSRVCVHIWMRLRVDLRHFCDLL